MWIRNPAVFLEIRNKMREVFPTELTSDEEMEKEPRRMATDECTV
jgi:hypothetical protein